MAQYYPIVSMELKSAGKNERSSIILDHLKEFDSGILVLEKMLNAVKVIPSTTRYYNEILGKARGTELTLDKLIARPMKQRTICCIKEGKISIVEEDIFHLYERAIERSFSLYVELEVSGNQIITRRTIQHVVKTVKDKKVCNPRPNNWNLNKDMIIKPVKEPYWVIQCMVNNDEDSLNRLYPLQYCIDNLVQPDGTGITDVNSSGTGSRQPIVSQSVPSPILNSDQYTHLETSSEYTSQTNLPTSHNSGQISMSVDGGSCVQIVSTSSLTSSGVRVPVASGGNASKSDVSELYERSNTEIIQWPQHPLFQEYSKRVASFATWQQFAAFDTVALAHAGFYYIGKGITVRCFFCGMEVANLSSNDDPILEHVRKSSSCGYLSKELGPRRIATYQEQIHNVNNSVSQDTNIDNASRVTSRNPGPWAESDHIRSPQYQVYSIRLSTFARWPSDIRQTPEQVADAGFYYTGLQDIVRCFACDGGLKNWDPEDDPWIEHARWFPQCPFTKRVKGQEFIDLVRRMVEDSDEEEDAVVHSTFQPNNPMAADSTGLRNELNPHLDEANAENVLETVAAKCVLEAGYPKDIVARTINELLTKGKVNYTSLDIMEIILEKEDRAELATEAHGHINPLLTPGTSNSTQRNGPVQNLIHENERLRQSMQCVECRVAKRDILLLPCMHLCLCSNCSNKASICPLCYKKIREKVKTYVI